MHLWKSPPVARFARPLPGLPGFGRLHGQASAAGLTARG